MKRFWDKVDKAPGCWVWTASRNARGYGFFWLEGKNVCAHRVAWVLSNGTIPDSSFVLHRCDNPSCVNPSHLFLGSPQDNMVDMENKGRTKHPPLKFTPDQAQELAYRHKNGESLRSLAREFNASRGAVTNAVLRFKTGKSARAARRSGLLTAQV